jgi:sec-independent protein translocase protein TatC
VIRRFFRALRLALAALLPGAGRRATRSRASAGAAAAGSGSSGGRSWRWFGWLRKRHNDPEGRMSILDHLRELRNRLIKVVLIVAVGATVAYFLYNPILDFLKHPYCDLSYKKRFPGIDTGSCSLVFNGVLDGFIARLKVSVIAGAVLTSPFWLWQIWAFVTPGLHKHEKRYAVTFTSAATVLFLAGCALAYVTLQKSLDVLIGSAGNDVQALLTINSYLSFVTLMLLAFGAALELPLLVVMLNRVGVLPYALLRRSQRISIFLLFVFAAAATPSGDPFTMSALAVPLVVLFEVAVLIAKFHDRRKAREREARRAQDRIDDQVPSVIDPFAAPMPQAEPTRQAAGERSSWDDAAT